MYVMPSSRHSSPDSRMVAYRPWPSSSLQGMLALLFGLLQLSMVVLYTTLAGLRYSTIMRLSLSKVCVGVTLDMGRRVVIVGLTPSPPVNSSPTLSTTTVNDCSEGRSFGPSIVPIVALLQEIATVITTMLTIMNLAAFILVGYKSNHCVENKPEGPSLSGRATGLVPGRNYSSSMLWITSQLSLTTSSISCLLSSDTGSSLSSGVGSGSVPLPGSSLVRSPRP